MADDKQQQLATEWRRFRERPFPYVAGVPNAELAELDGRAAGLLTSILSGINPSDRVRMIEELRSTVNSFDELREALNNDELAYVNAWVHLIASVE